MLGAYAPRMLRDYLLTRGAAMLVILAIIVLPPVLLSGSADPGPSPADRTAIALQIILTLTPFFSLVGFYGLIGQDFRLGHFRTLFSRPVHTLAYYVTLTACALIAFWATQLVLVGLMTAWGADAVLDLRILGDATARFLLLGSLVFAFSRASRLDWLLGYMLFAFGAALRGVYPPEESLRGRILDIVLPPAHLFSSGGRPGGQVTSPIFPEAGPEWTDLAWISGYTALAFAVGLALVRVVPMASEQ